MVRIYVDNVSMLDCESANMKCDTCVLSEVCNGEEIRLTGEEFTMLENCKLLRHTHYTGCDECPSRFICYTGRINKYAGKSIIEVLK